jgi:hypothetical protein
MKLLRFPFPVVRRSVGRRESARSVPLKLDCLPAGEQCGACLDPAGVGDRGDLGARDLAVARLAAQLADGLGGVAEGRVEAAAGQLAAPGVERQFAVQGDAGAALDERAGFPTGSSQASGPSAVGLVEP